MTRREQIQKKVEQFSKYGTKRAAFVEGATWADANPKGRVTHPEIVGGMESRIESLEQMLAIAEEALTNTGIGHYGSPHKDCHFCEALAKIQEFKIK